ncbi:MAG TPA: hypothetical protein VG734_11945 [Lacunisphaera sp.]|nr:hypothetical protein [Lacunisphaera sp.]
MILVLAALLAIWIGFQFHPQRKGSPPPLAPVQAESRLRSVGLRDNLDWDGLPEFFAIVADKAEWKDGKTRFSYWHPVMKDYSYYFEATRENGRVRFREIAEPHDPNYFWEEKPIEESRVRFYYSVPTPVPPPPALGETIDPAPHDTRLKVNIDKSPLRVPPPETKINSPGQESKPR